VCWHSIGKLYQTWIIDRFYCVDVIGNVGHYNHINNVPGVKQMITFNGKQYAKNDSEFTETLFQAGNTANGFYKKVKNGIKLYNIQKELIAFIKRDMQGDSAFIVNAYTYGGDGKDRYMASTSSTVEQYLGIYGKGYRETTNLCQETIDSVFSKSV
jgi:hypothetical protein